MPKNISYTSSLEDVHFEHLGIGAVLQRYRLKVPMNQREYSWESKQVLDLLRDLAGAIHESKSSYFLGTIVLTSGEDDVLEVADGQQRLATTTIILAAIRDFFVEKDEEMLVNSIDSEFLFKIDRKARDIEPRLTLNTDDNEYFRKKIISRPDLPERNILPTKPSHYKLLDAANQVSKHLGQIIKPHGDEVKTRLLNEWVDFIEKKTQVIVLKVPDDLDAFVMFETLNDRGLKTSQADLVKNYLFRESGDRISEAQKKWSAMNGALDSTGIDDITMTYLRHFLSSLHGLTRDKEVL